MSSSNITIPSTVTASATPANSSLVARLLHTHESESAALPGLNPIKWPEALGE